MFTQDTTGHFHGKKGAELLQTCPDYREVPEAIEGVAGAIRFRSFGRLNLAAEWLPCQEKRAK